jgi:peptidoglycan/LPS O-acetylase OafA/YrhL
MMDDPQRLKRYAKILLAGGLLMALLTPVYIVLRVPGNRVYYWNPAVFIMQAIPYGVCAALWLPSRNPSAPAIALTLSILLLISACVLYVPTWFNPHSGGDMVGLGILLVCIVSTLGVLTISLVAFVITKIRQRATPRG